MTPGQAAYEKWAGSVTAFAMGNAEQMMEVARFIEAITPKWEALSEAVKATWVAIADAAIDVHMEQDDCHS